MRRYCTIYIYDFKRTNRFYSSTVHDLKFPFGERIKIKCRSLFLICIYIGSNYGCCCCCYDPIIFYKLCAAKSAQIMEKIEIENNFPDTSALGAIL